MSPIDKDDLKFYSDTLVRYGYRANDFELAVGSDKNLRERDEQGAARSTDHGKYDRTVVNITCQKTKVSRLYDVGQENTWLLSFEEELGRGLYS